MEETSSMDEHKKSNTSYSGMLKLNLSQEIEAINRDIDEIFRRCDNYYRELIPTCGLHTSKKEDGLTVEQMRILSMRPPLLERSKEVALSQLKPKPSRHTTLKTSLDRNMEKEIHAHLRNLHKELSKRKRIDDDDRYLCEDIRGVSEVRSSICLERYLGCHKKSRRLHHNRLLKAECKDVFKECELDKVVKLKEEKAKYTHDTNCIFEPNSSCLVQIKKETQNTPKTLLEDACVDTETKDPLKCGPDVQNSFRRLSTSFVNVEKKEEVANSLSDNKFPDTDLQSVKTFANDVSNHTRGTKAAYLKRQLSDRVKANAELFENGTSRGDDKKEKDMVSLLFDRNMGLSLKESPKLKTGEGRLETTEDVVINIK